MVGAVSAFYALANLEEVAEFFDVLTSSDAAQGQYNRQLAELDQESKPAPARSECQKRLASL